MSVIRYANLPYIIERTPLRRLGGLLLLGRLTRRVSTPPIKVATVSGTVWAVMQVDCLMPLFGNSLATLTDPADLYAVNGEVLVNVWEADFDSFMGQPIQLCGPRPRDGVTVRYWREPYLGAINWKHTPTGWNVLPSVVDEPSWDWEVPPSPYLRPFQAVPDLSVVPVGKGAFATRPPRTFHHADEEYDLTLDAACLDPKDPLPLDPTVSARLRYRIRSSFGVTGERELDSLLTQYGLEDMPANPHELDFIPAAVLSGVWQRFLPNMTLWNSPWAGLAPNWSQLPDWTHPFTVLPCHPGFPKFGRDYEAQFHRFLVYGAVVQPTVIWTPDTSHSTHTPDPSTLSVVHVPPLACAGLHPHTIMVPQACLPSLDPSERDVLYTWASR